MAVHDPAGPTAQYLEGPRQQADDKFVSRFVLRIGAGDPAAFLDVPVRMEHGDRCGHEADHGLLAAVLAGAIERVLENHYAEAEIAVGVKP